MTAGPQIRVGTQQPQSTRLVCATRVGINEFFATTALGRSVTRFFGASYPCDLRLFPHNSQGLPAVYNEAVATAQPHTELFIFLHDDLWLPDLFWLESVAAGLAHFDVIGIVGNRRHYPRQLSCAFAGSSREFDSPQHLSGRIGIGRDPYPEFISCYGDTPAQCALLDGLFLAVRRRTLETANLRFDERFLFHCYDMDFCRQASAHGLRLGTWPISVVHGSKGEVGSLAWQRDYAAYLEKYGE